MTAAWRFLDEHEIYEHHTVYPMVETFLSDLWSRFLRDSSRTRPWDLRDGGYIPRLEIMERECWKFLDWRLNSDNDSRLHGQPSSSMMCPETYYTWKREKWAVRPKVWLVHAAVNLSFSFRTPSISWLAVSSWSCERFLAKKEYTTINRGNENLFIKD